LWGSRPQAWAENEELQVPTYEEAIKRVGPAAGARVLDIGCGTGAFLRLVAGRGAAPFGLDASQALLEVARERLPGADLRVGEMEQLPYDDDSFDLVTGFNSFFFTADLVAALREAGRVAKPGAPVVIQVWGPPERCDLEAMKQVARRYAPPPDPDAPPPPKLWEPGVLESLATRAGLVPDHAFDKSSPSSTATRTRSLACSQHPWVWPSWPGPSASRPCGASSSRPSPHTGRPTAATGSPTSSTTSSPEREPAP
jgi:SAM-dependent methyltransferase